ncbi:MAG: hypothetical protein ACEPOV_05820 [Hyphomicrobiales bacterium]
MKTLRISLITLVIILIQHKVSFGQSFIPTTDASTFALSKSNIASVYNNIETFNPAYTRPIHGLTIFSSISNKFGIKKLNFASVGVNYNSNKISVTTSYLSTGFGSYHESIGSLIAGRQFAKGISIGIGLHLLTIKESETNHTIYNPTFSMGLLLSFSKRINLGISIFNPFNMKEQTAAYNRSYNSAGISYLINENTEANIAIESNDYESFNLNGGLSLSLRKRFKIMMGASIYPSTLNFGCNINIKNLNICLSSCWSKTLGFSPNSSIDYRIIKGR